MTESELKNILRQQSSLFDQAVEYKLKNIMMEDDFNSDIFEQIELQCTDDELEKAFQENIGQNLDENHAFFSERKETLNARYSQKSEILNKEASINRILSYKEKVAALRGISMLEDFDSVSEC